MAGLDYAIDKAVQVFDRFQRPRPRLAFLLAVIKKFNEDEAGHRAALLAYYGFLSLFPLLLILTSIFRLLLRNQSQLGNDLLQGALTYFPAFGRQLQENVGVLTGTGLALAAGVAITAYGARGVGDVLRSSLDHIWQVPHGRRTPFPGSLFKSAAIILGGGLSLALAPVVTSYLLYFSPHRLSNLLWPSLVAIALFWVIIFVIKVGTSLRRPLHDIWPGAAIAAISLELLQSFGGYLMSHQLQRFDALYGEFAIVLGLLFWLYLQTQVLLWAFEFDSVRVYKLWPRSLHRPLTEADHKAYDLYKARADYHTEFLD